MTRRMQWLLAALAVLAVAAVIAWVARDRGGDDAVGLSASTTVETSTTTSIAATAGSAGVGDPYFPGLGNGGYDVDHYDLDLEWSADDGALEGVTTITATAGQDLSRFNLDLAGLDVDSVTVDGEPARIAHVERELEVTPARPIATGASFTAVVTYGGTPRTITDGTDLFEVGWRTDGREAFVVAEPAGASTFFPVNDHPSDKATYTFEVTAPADQVVATNGLLVASEDTGATKVWSYEARDPMASYLVQVAIGDFVLVDGGQAGEVTIRHVLHRSMADAARGTIERTVEMLDLLDDVYGPYPFEAYGVLAVDEALGIALETQTLTIIGTDLATAGRAADQILLHELAHQWVGNAVTSATWKDIWLNEGFATYSEWLWLERTGLSTAAAQARAAAGGSGLDVPPGDPGLGELFQPTVYRRGGMTLQALREAIGDDAFFTVLRAWIDEHRDESVTTQQFIDLAERVSGQPLDDLFARWLYAPRLPTLD